MNVTTRPLTKKEQQILKAMSRNPWGWQSILLIVLFFSFLSICIITALCRFVQILKPAQPYLVAIAIVGWCVYVIPSFLKRRKRFSNLPYQQDLNAGVAEISSFSPVDAIKVEEFEDEGSHYFLLLPDQSVIFLSGQYLYEPEEEKKFPCNNFTIIRAPHSKAFLNLICDGTYFAPSKTLKSFRTDLLKTGNIPRDGDILSIKWEDIENKYA